MVILKMLSRYLRTHTPVLESTWFAPQLVQTDDEVQIKQLPPQAEKIITSYLNIPISTHL